VTYVLVRGRTVVEVTSAAPLVDYVGYCNSQRQEETTAQDKQYLND
jgi:hypothetical protein